MLIKSFKEKMDVLKNFKKLRKLNRKGKLINKAEQEEDAEKNAVVSSLMAKFDKTNEEVEEAFKEFHVRHPDGFIPNDEFIESTMTKVEDHWKYIIHDKIVMQDFLKAKALVRVFDEDNSGTLTFYEWYQATNVKNMTTPEEKLNWIFSAFDADNGGSIDVEEIREIVVWMFRFAGIEEDIDLLESCVIDVRLVSEQSAAPAS